MKIELAKLNAEKLCSSVEVTSQMSSLADIEKSIIKQYRSKLWSPFIKGIQEFKMISEGDRIAVCISGGKDSLLLAKVMQEMQKYSEVNFELKFIAMNPGYNKKNYEMLEKTSKELGIELEVFDTKIFEIIEEISKDYPCYMCSRMRRGALYDYAQKLNCNKIALGHHYNDFIETILLNVLYAGNYRAMMPKIKAKNYDGIELIRPLVYVREDDIIKYTKQNNIHAMDCGCVVAAAKTSSKRKEVKLLIEQLKQVNPNIEKSIFASSKNVNISSIIGGSEDGINFNFLDKY